MPNFRKFIIFIIFNICFNAVPLTIVNYQSAVADEGMWTFDNNSIISELSFD